MRSRSRRDDLAELDLPDRDPAVERSADGLLRDGGLEAATVAAVCVPRASAALMSAGVLAPPRRKFRARSSLTLASARSACAAAS